MKKYSKPALVIFKMPQQLLSTVSFKTGADDDGSGNMGAKNNHFDDDDDFDNEGSGLNGGRNLWD